MEAAGAAFAAAASLAASSTISQEEREEEEEQRKEEVQSPQLPSGPAAVILRIQLCSAQGLTQEDVMLNAYATCEIIGKPHSRVRTRTLNRVQAPVWNEDVEVREFAVGDAIEFAVWDCAGKGSVGHGYVVNGVGNGKDQLLGRAALETTDFYPDGCHGDLSLSDTATGLEGLLTISLAVDEEEEEPPTFYNARSPQRSGTSTSSIATAQSASIAVALPSGAHDAFGHRSPIRRGGGIGDFGGLSGGWGDDGKRQSDAGEIPIGGDARAAANTVAASATPIQRLEVLIARAANWPRSGDSGRDHAGMRPFCVCEIPHRPTSRARTKAGTASGDLVWNQTFELDFLPGEPLMFTLWDDGDRSSIACDGAVGDASAPTSASTLALSTNRLLGRTLLAGADFYPGGCHGELRFNDGAVAGVSLLVRVVVRNKAQDPAEALAARIQRPLCSLAASRGLATLEVLIVGAKGLSSCGGTSEELRQTMAPYCVFEVAGKPHSNFQTSVARQTCDPVWNYKFQTEYCLGESLRFEVWNRESLPGRHKMIARATLISRDFYPHGYMGDYQLASVDGSDTSSIASASLALSISVLNPGSFSALSPSPPLATEMLTATAAKSGVRGLSVDGSSIAAHTAAVTVEAHRQRQGAAGVVGASSWRLLAPKGSTTRPTHDDLTTPHKTWPQPWKVQHESCNRRSATGTLAQPAAIHRGRRLEIPGKTSTVNAEDRDNVALVVPSPGLSPLRNAVSRATQAVTQRPLSLCSNVVESCGYGGCGYKSGDLVPRGRLATKDCGFGIL
eukprot:TRINITY_DN62503_c0_g1_i1.p1 TRINITY_DN62503_c0_g1~~TRINITY_DN62503_c0_g1_i1.p1  ORF type:complete len:789 (+),score=118.99 TRINITY_DN62503_c0_g1_i1:111-2477(+)